MTGTFSGVISGSQPPVVQNGPGTTILSGTNTYTGNTTISSGALQANSGTGLPAASLLLSTAACCKATAPSPSPAL